MAVDAQTLLTQAQCLECYFPNLYTVNLAKLALLQQILLAKNPSATVDPQGLMNLAKCFQCYSGNEYALRLLELALLSQITGP